MELENLKLQEVTPETPQKLHFPLPPEFLPQTAGLSSFQKHEDELDEKTPSVIEQIAAGRLHQLHLLLSQSETTATLRRVFEGLKNLEQNVGRPLLHDLPLFHEIQFKADEMLTEKLMDLEYCPDASAIPILEDMLDWMGYSRRRALIR